MSKTPGTLIRRALVVATAFTTLTIVAPTAVNAGPGDPIEIGPVVKCIEAVPASVGVNLDGSRVELQVAVLLDGVTLQRGQEIMTRAATSYAPLGIDLTATYQAVSFSGTEGASLIAQSKSYFGGRRPAGSDVVYTVSSKNLTSDGNTSLAGLADCIGGVAFADRAFAVGEAYNGPNSLLSYEVGPKIAAHEIGHLMGAHHHYANCVQGVQPSDANGDLASPCTLMFNAVNGQSLNFSTLNGLIVRGHAKSWAN